MSQKVPLVSSDDLKAQKRVAEERLDVLRHEQVAALEEGREFEHNGEILLTSERIDALKKAVERAEKREDDARERRIRELERKRLEQIRSKAVSLVEKRNEALQDAEGAMSQTIEAIQRYLKANDDLAGMMQHAKPIFARHGVGDQEYSEFGVGNVQQRLSLYLSLAFDSLDLQQNHLGQVTWHSNPGVRGSWNENETKAISGLFNGVFLRGIDHVLKELPELADEKA
ncbi:hypothetical protein [Agrobacterium pusense]|uniref:Uncharacterized protein n=1 Tax=Agrobacterium pusense TaxID=648995 RepID=A0AA44J1Y9_9HYPH|nr:hypothetical protein [Agrobacterium pusense]NRF12279.1 hypothetical protein [Agrobacterium pusense]NRF22989.1 hypothetical protein [Agrobacterium pusense]